MQALALPTRTPGPTGRPAGRARTPARAVVTAKAVSPRGVKASSPPKQPVPSNAVLGQSPEEWGARTTGFAIPVVLASEVTLKITGQGLEPGPGGLYGAAEGVSYLVLGGFVAWSLYSKATTGMLLRDKVGPCCLLVGKVEPIAYVVAGLGLAVVGANAAGI